MITFIVMLALAFGVGGSLLISTSTHNSIAQSQESAVSSHRLILYTLSAVSGSTQEYDELAAALARIDSQGGQNWVSLRLSDMGEVIYSSGESADYDNSLVMNTETGRYAMLMFRSRAGEYLLQIASGFDFGGTELYLESVYNLSPVFIGRQYQLAIYQRLFIAVVMLGGAVSWLLSYWMTMPLRRLSRVTRTIASGDLSCRAAVNGKDEIGVLAADFNNMADRLESNINELKDSMKRQEEFMGGLAHELKTPMTSIIGYADLLRSHSLSDDDRQDAANYIFTEGRRLEVLSLKLLDLIVLKRRDFTFVPAKAAHIVNAAARLLRPVLIRQNIRLTYNCDDGMCMMEPDLVMSLLLNLIDNARKALDSGGDIRVTAKTAGEICTIRVSDNGRGIAVDELNKIKDAFYRVDKSRSRAQGGVGLGLKLCDEIVILHGGEISFESELGQGTTVTVTLGSTFS